jgi:hypothetical protein
VNIVLPKASRGYQFPRLWVVELNDFDIERLLPSLFYLVVTHGRARGNAVNGADRLEEYLDTLRAHERVVGFRDEDGERVIEKWVRTAAVKIGRAGRGRKAEQIEYVRPLTLLSYKTGFPAEIRRQRNVHVFLYKSLVDSVSGKGGAREYEHRIEEVFRSAFARGVIVDSGPGYDGRYDGQTEIDIQSLLCLCFLDGLAATPVAQSKVLRYVQGYDPALPTAARFVGRDALGYLQAYASSLPAIALVKGLQALINLDLLIYTVKLVYGINELVGSGDLPVAFQDRAGMSSPELYVDFTQHRGSVSDSLARACVERDMEELGRFFRHSLLLRTLERFVEFIPTLKDRLKGLTTPEYLRALLDLRSDLQIQARAQLELEAIRAASLETCSTDTEREDVTAFFESRMRSGSDMLSIALDCLEMPQKKKGTESYVMWYWSVGGLRKPFGLLVGNWGGARNWRYAMSDDLLATLVRLALVEDTDERSDGVRLRSRMRLKDFLSYLERRFGVLVDRPPALLDSSETRMAAARNLEALKRRLRQMGFFTALSDDFTAQYIHTRARDEVTA